MPRYVFDVTFVVSAEDRAEAEFNLIMALAGTDNGDDITYERLEGGEEVED